MSSGGDIAKAGTAGPDTVGTVVPVRRMGIGEATERAVLEAGAFGYRTVAVAANRFRLARSVRPRWALITACCLAPLLGLGLIFLLVRTTESCDLVVVDGAGGVTIRFIGPVDAVFLERCRAVFEVATSTGPATAAAAPPVSPSVVVAPVTAAASAVPAPVAAIDGVTVVRGASPLPQPLGVDGATVVRAPNPTPAPVVSWTLVVDDGRRFELGTGVVVGRAPAAHATYPHAALIAIDDLGLSKSHAAFGVDGGVAWVEDLHSTNGTVVRYGAERVSCAPGSRVRLEHGAEVELGDRLVSVVTGR